MNNLERRDLITTESIKYFTKYWEQRRKFGNILPQSGYFDQLRMMITYMSEGELNHFAADHIGELYNLLAPPVSNSTC